MKELLNERLILLATTQEQMTKITDMMEQWSDSQQNTEKDAFDAMNVSDHVLNSTKEGKKLLDLLEESVHDISSDIDSGRYFITTGFLNEIRKVFNNLTEQSVRANEISHKIEAGVACQMELVDEIKNRIEVINDAIDSTVACAEIIIADL